jgi:hypothetical protein
MLTTWHPFPQKLALSSLTSGGRSRTRAMEFFNVLAYFIFFINYYIKANTKKYAPPHVRGSILNEDPKKQEQLKCLRRQLKGLLNRLAENNMNSIALQVRTSAHSA